MNTVGAYNNFLKEAGLLLMIFILSRGREGGREWRVHHEEKARVNNPIEAIEINVVGNSASIAVVISFINTNMRRCLPNYTKN